MNKSKSVDRKKVERLKTSIEQHLKYSLGRRPCEARKEDIFRAIALTVREFAIDGMFDTAARYEKKDAKRVYYLSVEYLIGRLLENNLRNLELYEALEELDLDCTQDIREVLDCEYDPALGNGGLGRLAACFLDSMASLGIPGFGYGINYKFGLFKQSFQNGYQVEKADSWLESNSPWQIERPDRELRIPLYGRVDENNNWVDQDYLLGVPYDMPIVGYGGKTVNYLRLFSAHTSDALDISTFNEGGYIDAVKKKIKNETVSKVLYPSDAVEAGKKLRLTQQYFFVTCAIQDILRRYLEKHEDLRKLHEKVAIQLNDTHPALAVPELMRILIDERGLNWDDAWYVTTNTLAYTNHTLLPEALERWPVDTIGLVLPRHLQIIYEINNRLLTELKERYPDNHEKIERMSIIEEGKVRQVRMSNLAIVGSHSTNGVAALHTELIKKNLVPDFYEMWPEKFNNKTNGITPRRWLLTANNELAQMITERIGDSWIANLDDLKKLEEFSQDKKTIDEFYKIKKYNKKRLAKIIFDTTGVKVDTNSMFDIQIKRIHEYKRQLLNAMHIIHLYHRIVKDDVILPTPITFVFGGKAAPSYHKAKLIIKLINNIAKVVNNDPKVKNQIKVAFIPDYKVSVAERMFPASDLSEQVSTAGFEASGTGNMKFALNGALTIGTLDGANIEIREEVGEENFYLFGHTVEQLDELRNSGSYNPWDIYNNNADIRRIMNSLSSDEFCKDEAGLIFKPIFDDIMSGDYYFLLADLPDYIETHEKVTEDYTDKKLWATKALLNIARIGKFSSDRTISEYARDIWAVKPIV